MKILGLETSGELCNVALGDGEKILGECSISLGLRHSEFLFVLIEQIMNNVSWELSDLDAVACDYRTLIFINYFSHLRIESQSADIVHYIRSLFNRPVCNLRLICIN